MVVNIPHAVNPRAALRGLLPPALCLLSAAGCAWDGWSLWQTPGPKSATDSLVVRADGTAAPAPRNEELERAKEVYRQGELAKAERLFHKVAENKKNPAAVAEEARYYEAEALRGQGRYPKAADTYTKMLNDFPSGSYREQALQHMYDIANFWLDDTRKEMEETKEKREGKRWFVVPRFVNFDKAKPLLDEQGRALEKLEQVRYNDMTGPLADKALFLMGRVHFFNENYIEADHNFSQLVEMHPNSPLAPQAVELAILSKHLSTGGADYDGRKVAEARQLVHTALGSYPELANHKGEFLQRQLLGITLQQAEKDFKTAEFYRRTGHPESAYFYYEIVRRRYPGTKFHAQADERIREIEAKAKQPATGMLERFFGDRGPAKAAPAAAPPPGQPAQPAPAEGAPAPRPLPDAVQAAPLPPPPPAPVKW
jgi:outer membrane protein assembly factor BamD (BamD/ComL family)